MLVAEVGCFGLIKTNQIQRIWTVGRKNLKYMAVRFDRVVSVINQINDQAKVVVPKFVAEWIEKCKDMNRSLRDAMKNTELSAELNAWFLKTGQDMFTYPNQETFARAWLDGYEVEQEKEYVVTDGNKLYLKEFDELNAVIIIDDVVGSTDYAKRYSDINEAQKAAAELGWKVVEVE